MIKQTLPEEEQQASELSYLLSPNFKCFKTMIQPYMCVEKSNLKIAFKIVITSNNIVIVSRTTFLFIVGNSSKQML